MMSRRIGASSRIVHGGENLETIFIVAEGIVSRSYLGRDEQVEQQRFIATEYFGEEALISGLPHQSTVMANTNVLIYELTKEILQKLLMKYPQLHKQLATNLAKAHFNGNATVLEKSNTFEYQKSLYEGMIRANFRLA